MFLAGTSSSTSSKAKCCEFLLKKGWCAYGWNCRFSHELPLNIVLGENDETLASKPKESFQPVSQLQQISTECHYEQDVELPQTTLNDSGENALSGTKISNKQPQSCRYFDKDLRCPFGVKCKFFHKDIVSNAQNGAAAQSKYPSRRFSNQGNKSNPRPAKKEQRTIPDNWRERRDVPVPAKPKNKPPRVCRYYLKNTCRNGDKCKYSHLKDETNETAIEKLAEEVQQMSTGFEEEEKIDGAVISASEKIPAKRIIGQKPEYYIKDLTDNRIKELREIEICQMKKRIIKENLEEMDDEMSYIVIVSPTDPDWPYDIREVKLRISYPTDYPKEILQIEATCEDNDLPSTLIQHINNCVNEWLEACHQKSKDAGKVELIFRPFLKWFDRNLEDIFTCGLKKTKRHVEAKAAGIEFVPFTKLPGYDSTNPTQTDTVQNEINQQCDVTNSLDVQEDHQIQINDNEQVTLNSNDLFQISKKGTELKWCNLQLGENIATVVCQSLHLTIQCTRCSAHHDINTIPRRKNVVPCTKCHQSQFVTFRPAMVHHCADILGYVDVDGCRAFDLPMVDSTFSIACLNCNKQKSADGLHYGQMWTNWCHSCNAKLEILVSSFKFQILRPGTQSGAGSVNIIKLDKKDKKVKDPSIQEGKPLPNNGTCKHYKKSYRWFRFPCCGKAYPCDLCHNEKELEHEMKMANRIICGFCAKEQPFSSKPCTTCSSNMTQNLKGHWEGGKGCRDKTKMSRDDRQKYTGLSKTTAKSVKDRKQVVKTSAA